MDSTYISEVTGMHVHLWPPVGDMAELWAKVDAITTDEEKLHLRSLLTKWENENSTLHAYGEGHGELVDVEPDWSEVEKWL